MLQSVVESYLRHVQPGLITEIFLWLLLACLVLALGSVKRGRWPLFTTYAPTLLTSLGILGTFIGVVVGLLNFDPDQIDESVGRLLEGLTTAFITSIAGMGASILYRVLLTTPYFLDAEVTRAEEEIGADDIYQALQDQTNLLRETQRAIAGEEDSSLVAQIRLLRLDINDQKQSNEEWREQFGSSLLEKLDEVQESLAQAATEQVIQALQQVITDFNNNLTEQFGENFRELNAAVGQLVTWQNNHLEQMNHLYQLYDQSVQSITNINTAVQGIAESTANIPDTMQALEPIIQAANLQIANLEQHIATLIEIRDRASQAIPQIQAATEQMTNHITTSINEVVEGIQGAEDLMQQQFNTAIEQIQQQFNMMMEQIQQGAQGAAEELANQMQDSMQQMANILGQMLQHLTNEYHHLNNVVAELGGN